MTTRATAITVGLITSLIYGSLSVFSRWMDLGFAPIAQVYLRVLGAALLGSLLFSRDLKVEHFRKLSLSDWLLLLFMGLGGYGLMVYAITLGALQTSLLNVSVIFSTVPLFVYPLSIIFFKTKFNLRIIALLLISIWGVGILASSQVLPNLTQFGRGDWWVLLSTLMEAGWFIGLKVLANKLSSRELAVTTQLIAAGALIGVSFALGEPTPSLSVLSNWLVTLGLLGGLLANLFTPVMTVFVFKNLNAVFASQLFLFENIFALLIGWFFYKEMFTPTQLFGAVTVISSVYFMNKIHQS